jgi:hypothetical protein
MRIDDGRIVKDSPGKLNKSYMGKKLFLAGCWAMIVTGLLHSFGLVQMVAGQQQGANPTETQLLQLMQTYRDPQVGRTMWELMTGFSMIFSVVLFGLGGVGISMSKYYGPPSTLVTFHTLMAGILLLISIVYFFFIPTTCLAIVFGLFVGAAFTQPPERLER